MKDNLLRLYHSFTDEELNSCKKPLEYKKLLFGLCQFHTMITERSKYGSIGWNIVYEFTDSDLFISMEHLKVILNSYK